MSRQPKIKLSSIARLKDHLESALKLVTEIQETIDPLIKDSQQLAELKPLLTNMHKLVEPEPEPEPEQQPTEVASVSKRKKKSPGQPDDEPPGQPDNEPPGPPDDEPPGPPDDINK